MCAKADSLGVVFLGEYRYTNGAREDTFLQGKLGSIKKKLCEIHL